MLKKKKETGNLEVLTWVLICWEVLFTLCTASKDEAGWLNFMLNIGKKMWGKNAWWHG